MKHVLLPIRIGLSGIVVVVLGSTTVVVVTAIELVVQRIVL